MSSNIEARINRLKNELKALKATQFLAGGTVESYEASANWNGEVDGSEAIDTTIIAAFEMTFVRTDGISGVPIVDFAFTTNPNGDKPGAFTGLISRSTENSVTFLALLPMIFGYFQWSGAAQDEVIGHTHLDIYATAYSLVPGTLTIRRVYEY